MPYLEEILTINSFHEKSIKEKGSLFSAQAFPVSTEEEISDILTGVKKKYYDASHHCYAYKLLSGQFKYSDDGEPTGTAGIRILNAIDHFELLNTFVIVIRYFGGTKLGVGPLGKAYYNSAELVLKDSVKIKKTAYKKIQISAGFEHTSLLHKSSADFKLIIQNTEYNENVVITCLIKPKLVDKFSEYLIDKTRGEVKIFQSKEIEYY